MSLLRTEMQVTIEYFGPARDAVGVSRETLDCEAATAHELVERVARERGGRLASLLLQDGRLAKSVLVAVNDRQVSADEVLRDGDVVSIIPPVSGGSR